MMAIINAKNKKARTAAYRDLVYVTWQTIGYADEPSTNLTTLKAEKPLTTHGKWLRIWSWPAE